GSFTADSVVAGPGGAVIFSADRHPDDPPRHTRLWLIEAGGSLRCVTESLDRHAVTGSGASGPDWLPDGRTVLVSIHQRGNVPVLAIDTVAGTARTVIGGERSVSSFSVDAAGKQVALVASTPERPGEVFIADLDGGNERRLTGLNDGWLGEVEL